MRALSIGLFCLASACASFEEGALPYLDQWQRAAPPSLGELEVEITGLPGKFDAGWRAAILRVVAERGRSTPRAPGEAGAAARRMSVEVEHRRQPLWLSRTWMAACALTAGALPARARHAFDVRATFLDASGRRLGVAQRRVESATWIGWIFLPAMPFAGVGTTSLVEDTCRSLLGEARVRGWL